MTQLLFVVCVMLAGPRELQAGLATSLHDSTGALTSIVVADIDRDGDADVVATDEALHLFVWINDGTGRLTRQHPAARRDGCTGAEPHGVERGAPASEPTAPNDPPSVDAHVTAPDASPLVWRRVFRLASADRRDAPRAAHRLRGPPAATSPL